MMLKGICRIELKNVHTGKKQVIESHNVITDGLQEVFNRNAFLTTTAADEIGLNALSNRLCPFSSNGLGGLVLLDSTLDAQSSNWLTYNPAKVVGYGDRTANTTIRRKGSLNALESKVIDNGYTSVWDFNTSQGNGTIRCASLTNVSLAADPLCPHIVDTTSPPLISFHCTDDVSTECQGAIPLFYKDHYLYVIYQRDHVDHIYDNAVHFGRVKVPFSDLGVNGTFGIGQSIDMYPASEPPAALEDIPVDMSGDPNAIHDLHCYTYGDDGIIYGATVVEDGGLCVCKINTSNWSYIPVAPYSLASLFEDVIIAQNISVTGGYMYIVEDHPHSLTEVWIVNMNNWTDLRRVLLPDPYKSFQYFQTASTLYNLTSKNVYSYGSNCCCIPVHDSTNPILGGTNGAMAIVYPDETYVISDTQDLITGSNTLWLRPRIVTDEGFVFNYVLSNYQYYDGNNAIPANTDIYFDPFPVYPYLGTIYNLPSGVTKTAAQTMKVIYTLKNEVS